MGSGVLFPAMATATLIIVLVQAAAGISEKNMVFYMHDNLTGGNVTSFPVAGLNGSSSAPGKFGTIVIMSDPITKQPQVIDSEGSNFLGRAQGSYINTNPHTGMDFLMVFTITFQNMEYNGSTLQIQGIEKFDRPVREYALVGGTGQFRFARGYVVCTTESASGENAVLRFNTTFRTD